MGMLPERAIALETLDLCANLRAATWDLIREVQDAMFDGVRRLVDQLPAPPIVLLAAIAEALRPARPHSTKDYNPCATLSEQEYIRRYELGRQRYLRARDAKRLRRGAWFRENAPWMLLALIGALVAAFLGVARPHGIVVLTALALYSGLAWVVCWVVRTSS
jgi:hypothetical protein